MLRCNPFKLYIFHHLLRPNHVPLDLEQKTHCQGNLSKFLIDTLRVDTSGRNASNDDRQGESVKRGQFPFFAQNSLYRNKFTSFMSS